MILHSVNLEDFFITSAFPYVVTDVKRASLCDDEGQWQFH